MSLDPITAARREYVLGNFSLPTAPTVNHDRTQGYRAGSLVRALDTGRFYRLYDDSPGEADWRQVVLLNADGELVGPIIPRRQTSADLIALEGVEGMTSGEIAWSTDDAIPVYYDGTNWRLFSDNTLLSAV